MNTRYPFRILSILVAFLGFQILVSAQSFSDASHVSPDASSACATCTPAQNFSNATTSNTTAKSVSAQTINSVPLPTSGLIQLKGIAFDRYSVYDGKGELWIGGPKPADQTIDLHHLPAGVYYLHLSSKDGEIVRKVLKKD